MSQRVTIEWERIDELAVISLFSTGCDHSDELAVIFAF